MTPPTPPTMSIGRASREVLRDPWWWVWLAAAIAWCGYWTWSDWTDGSPSGGLTFGILAVWLLGPNIHRQVRGKRGFTGEHWASPPIAGAVALAILLVVDAIEPVMSLRTILTYVGGLTAIHAAFTYGEHYYNARRNRAVREQARIA